MKYKSTIQNCFVGIFSRQNFSIFVDIIIDWLIIIIIRSSIKLLFSFLNINENTHTHKSFRHWTLTIYNVKIQGIWMYYWYISILHRRFDFDFFSLVRVLLLLLIYGYWCIEYNNDYDDVQWNFLLFFWLMMISNLMGKFLFFFLYEQIHAIINAIGSRYNMIIICDNNHH